VQALVHDSVLRLEQQLIDQYRLAQPSHPATHATAPFQSFAVNARRSVLVAHHPIEMIVGAPCTLELSGEQRRDGRRPAKSPPVAGLKPERRRGARSRGLGRERRERTRHAGVPAAKTTVTPSATSC
jgi:hypothetical protein